MCMHMYVHVCLRSVRALRLTAASVRCSGPWCMDGWTKSRARRRASNPPSGVGPRRGVSRVYEYRFAVLRVQQIVTYRTTIYRTVTSSRTQTHLDDISRGPWSLLHVGGCFVCAGALNRHRPSPPAAVAPRGTHDRLKASRPQQKLGDCHAPLLLRRGQRPTCPPLHLLGRLPPSPSSAPPPSRPHALPSPSAAPLLARPHARRVYEYADFALCFSRRLLLLSHHQNRQLRGLQTRRASPTALAGWLTARAEAMAVCSVAAS